MIGRFYTLDFVLKSLYEINRKASQSANRGALYTSICDTGAVFRVDALCKDGERYLQVSYP